MRFKFGKVPQPPIDPLRRGSESHGPLLGILVAVFAVALIVAAVFASHVISMRGENYRVAHLDLVAAVTNAANQVARPSDDANATTAPASQPQTGGQGDCPT